MAKGGGNSATWGQGAKGKGQIAKGKGGKGKRDRYAREVRPATSGVAVVLPALPLARVRVRTRSSRTRMEF